MRYLISAMLFCASFGCDLSYVKASISSVFADLRVATTVQASEINNFQTPDLIRDSVQRTYVEVVNGEPCRGTPGAC